MTHKFAKKKNQLLAHFLVVMGLGQLHTQDGMHLVHLQLQL